MIHRMLDEIRKYIHEGKKQKPGEVIYISDYLKRRKNIADSVQSSSQTGFAQKAYKLYSSALNKGKKYINLLYNQG